MLAGLAAVLAVFCTCPAASATVKFPPTRGLSGTPAAATNAAPPAMPPTLPRKARREEPCFGSGAATDASFEMVPGMAVLFFVTLGTAMCSSLIGHLSFGVADINPRLRFGRVKRAVHSMFRFELRSGWDEPVKCF